MDKRCDTCFYSQLENDQHPCSSCFFMDKYIPRDLYIKQLGFKDEFSDHGGGSTLDDYPELKVNIEEDNNSFYSSEYNAVENPKHYTAGKFEVIEVIEDWNLNFRLANTIKYIARHKHKGKPLEDLKKALWYLQREIDLYESNI